jgi:hypothetical protein
MVAHVQCSVIKSSVDPAATSTHCLTLRLGLSPQTVLHGDSLQPPSLSRVAPTPNKTGCAGGRPCVALEWHEAHADTLLFTTGRSAVCPWGSGKLVMQWTLQVILTYRYSEWVRKCCNWAFPCIVTKSVPGSNQRLYYVRWHPELMRVVNDLIGMWRSPASSALTYLIH